MNCVILCTEKERGLFPVNENVPDSMLDFVGQTSAAHAVKSLSGIDCKKLYAVAGELADRVRAYFDTAELSGIRPELVLAEEKLCSQLYSLSDSEGLVVCDASCLIDLPLEDLIANYRSERRAFAVSSAVAVVSDDDTSGSRIRSEDGRLISIKKGMSDLSDSDGSFAGAAVFSQELLERIRDKDYLSLEQIISALVIDGEETAVCFLNGSFHALNSPVDYRNAVLSTLARGNLPDAVTELEEGIYAYEKQSFSGITLIPPVYIGKGAVIEKGSVIENCVISDNAAVGARSELKDCVIGESARIGSGVIAEGAVICPGAEIRPAARLFENCAIGENALVGSGSHIKSGVIVGGGRKTASGEIISENVSSGDGSPAVLDEECSMELSCKTISPSECSEFARAVGTSVRSGITAVCGCTGSDGASALLSAFESGLISTGVNVISIGFATPQEVMFLVNRLGADLGCCVNAGFSGRIQLMCKGGLALPTQTQVKIERCAALKRFRTLSFDRYGERYKLEDAKALYKMFIAQHLPDIFRGVNADVRCSAAPFREIAEKLIRPRNDIEGERIIFHISNDGKGCTAYTDDTGYVTNEKLVLIAVKAAFEKEIPVALPFTFPMAADRLAEICGGKLYRYFHSPLDEADGAARSVASRPDNFFVRDGMSLTCTICAYLSEKGITLKRALEDIPEFYSAQRFAASDCPPAQVFKRLGCKKDCGGVIMRSENTRAMIRPLRHRRGVIIFTESARAETASELCDDIIRKIKDNGKKTK
ncbi:MAG: hypothetical protein ACI4JW_00735 [Oscillospiraceae bacterium]